MRKRAKYTLISVAIAASILSWILVGGFVIRIMREAYYYQCVLGKPLERELGFEHGSPYIHSGDEFIEVMAFENIKPGGIFDLAGIKKGDIPIDDLSITEFFRMLENARGTEVTITVVSGGDGPPLEERPARKVTFKVPEKNPLQKKN